MYEPNDSRTYADATVAGDSPRLRIENRSLMQILTRMMIPPPPRPWMARLAISMLMLTLVALSRDPTQKTATAMSRMGLRPQMSEILPHIGAAAELASRYALPIHV